MSQVILDEDNRKHLEFLSNQPPQVLQDFCKLTNDYFQKGHNYKLYINAAQKLEVEPDNIKQSIEGLINLLIESCKNKLTPDDFKELVISLGFIGDKEPLITNLYTSKKSELESSLSNIGFKLPEYHNMEWRFETQIASRSMLKQCDPFVTMDFALKILTIPKNFNTLFSSRMLQTCYTLLKNSKQLCLKDVANKFVKLNDH